MLRNLSTSHLPAISYNYPMLTWTEIETRAIAFQRKAHRANDKAAWAAYAKPWHPLTSEPSCVAYLVEMYQTLVESKM